MAGRPVVLLTGNGICIQTGQDKFEDILEEIRVKENPEMDIDLIGDLSFPMKIVMVSGDKVDKYMKSLSGKMTGIRLTEDNRIFIKSILDIDLSAVLTANYSYELESAILGKYTSGDYKKYKRTSGSDKAKSIPSQLYQYTDLSAAGCRVPIWHIHGEAHKPNSMIMGHYYYGKLLREIEEYISGAMSRLKVLDRKGAFPIKAKSWVDLFLLGDVHMIGFSMSLSESDLWWLACCKKRNFPDSHIYYYKDHKENDLQKMEMMKTYGIEIKAMKDKVRSFTGYYEESFSLLRRLCDQQRESG